MMSEEQLKKAIEIFDECGLGWWTRAGAGAEHFRSHLSNVLEAFATSYSARSGTPIDSFTVFKIYPEKKNQVKAFLQAVASTSSGEMLSMVWRIIQGMEIQSLEMRYKAQQQFFLEVVLTSSHLGGKTETYTSTNIDDAALVRHLGIMKMGDKPIFDGFYALRLIG